MLIVPVILLQANSIACESQSKNPSLLSVTYLRQGAMVVTTLKNASIPKELIMNRDETSNQLLPRADTTKSKKGSKKVRVIGMVDDKAQCTNCVLFELTSIEFLIKILNKFENGSYLEKTRIKDTGLSYFKNHNPANEYRYT